MVLFYQSSECNNISNPRNLQNFRDYRPVLNCPKAH